MSTVAAMPRSPITTHVLDTTIGRPAADVAVTLHLLTPSKEWTRVGTQRTNADGRCTDLVPMDPATNAREPLVPGAVYKLTFDIDEYLARVRGPGARSFFPVAEIQFRVGDEDGGAGGHYHVPLVLSGFAYSTYRGS